MTAESADEPEEMPKLKESFVQTDMDCAKLSLLVTDLEITKKENKLLKMKIISFESLRNNDEKCRFYTGLTSFKVLNVIIKWMRPFLLPQGKFKLNTENQIVLTLVKLRLDLKFQQLGFAFGVHPSTVSSCFKKVVSIMSRKLKSLIVWPDRSSLIKTMPGCFQKSFGDRISIIIDCFESHCQRPSDPMSAAITWSYYKNSQTVKYLIGITPQGSVSFISEGWGGRASDKFITQHSEFLTHLHCGDVLADRGFLIKEFVELFNASVIIPAFTKGLNQIHPSDLENTRAIANVRIHVEKIISLLKQKFTILAGKVPIKLLATRADVALLDDIVNVCCGLIFICPPVIPLD
ncbi:uncharacterized protein LOC123306940 [Coccinella septempunctata]|uniref:uncharacterized protein LOC123306940 n=1 Tax=Coccinella septempunctata TaxID=41139 RepID=UPI001D065879|nr:uncharacterized protein LOC123306940 [Coccinella septempunctata]